MKLSKPITALAVALIFFLWVYSFFSVPTFDLDESLYRRVAEEMKWTSRYWMPTWDGWPLFHKPPIFYWIIVFFSRIFDGADAGVSILAARFPSFLATLGILGTLGFFRKQTPQEAYPSLVRTFLLWGCALFPLITSTSVIFDPLQTLALLPCLLLPHQAFIEERSLSKKEMLWMALSMFMGTAIKGLTGLILPTLALGIHLLISNKRDFKTTIKEGLRFFCLSFLPATLLSGLYYFYLDQKIGRPFTEEFFLVHHFGRGVQAMEAHKGPFFYYIAVTLLGGGLLIPLLAYQAIRTRFDYKKLGYPLSFAIGVTFFFSLSATKLPHYTWPVWPALILQLLTILELPGKNNNVTRSPVWKIFLIPIALLGLAIFWFVMNPEVLPQTEIDQTEILFFSAAATLCLMAVFLFRKFVAQLEFLSFFMTLITLLIAVPLASIATRVLVDPYFEIAEALKKVNPKPTACIRDSGNMTATLSLAFGQVLGREYVHNRCEPPMMEYLIAPPSKRAECAERKMSVLHEGKTLILCGHL